MTDHNADHPAEHAGALSPEEPMTMLTLYTHTGQPVLYRKPAAPATFNESTGDGVSWAGWTWNPVTGCSHGCTYCYARAIAKRFTTAFPAGFVPLFHEERLPAPANTRIPRKRLNDPAYRRVFVVSMGDLFGRWVPAQWIDAVLAAERESPQWEYLHLTKFPDRYPGLPFPAGAWVGTSVDEQNRVRIAERAMRAVTGDRLVKWLSLEPLKADLVFSDVSMFDWIVIGSQTGTMQPDGPVAPFAPPAEWVLRITHQAREAGVPVHWKPNLRANPGVVGDLGPVWYDQYPAGMVA